MKTIFLSSFHGIISRNILSTDALGKLTTHNDIRVVIFVIKDKKDFFKKHFEQNNVIIEPIPFGPPSTNSKFSLIMKRMAKFGLDSASTRIERRAKWKQEGKFLYFLNTSVLAWTMSHLSIARRAMRFLDYHLAVKDRYTSYIKKYQPDLIVVTDVQNERDVELMHAARYSQCPLIGMVRSWDNLTLHGLLRVLPDTLLVTSPRVRDLAITLHDMYPDRVEIIGIPHYDNYLRVQATEKKEFLERMGFNENKKTIFYTPISDYYIAKNDTDPYVLSLLEHLPLQIIVRFPPSLEVKGFEGHVPPENVFFDRPDVRFKEGGLNPEDDRNLMHGLAFSDIIVCGPSTIALDAMLFDKPTILINFHPKKLSYLESIARRYDYDHFIFAIKAGACKVAHSKEELFKYIDEYLTYPSRDSEGRQRLRNAYIGPCDGKSGARMANVVLRQIRESHVVQ